ncbi:MAG: hypothetical protein ACYDEO_11365 [Aggregatilineales bacterium]
MEAALSPAQRAILSMQQTRGNAAVRRMLNRGASTIQRDPPAASGGSSGWSFDPANPTGRAANSPTIDLTGPNLGMPSITDQIVKSMAAEPGVRQWIWHDGSPQLRAHADDGIDGLITFTQQNAPRGRDVLTDTLQQMISDWANQQTDLFFTRSADERAVRAWITQNSATLRSHVFDGMPALMAYLQLSAPQGSNVPSARLSAILNFWAGQQGLSIPPAPMFGAVPPAGGNAPGSRSPVQGQLSYSLVTVKHVAVGNNPDTPNNTEAQPQFSVNLTWQMHQENQAGLEVSAVVQMATNSDFTQVANIQGGGQVAWVAPALHGLLQLSGFAQLLSGAAMSQNSNPVTGRTQLSIAPTAQAAFGGQALFQLFGGRVQVGPQVGVGPTGTFPSGQPPQYTMDVSVGGVIQFAF